jgi:hypothetical protein
MRPDPHSTRPNGEQALRPDRAPPTQPQTAGATRAEWRLPALRGTEGARKANEAQRTERARLPDSPSSAAVYGSVLAPASLSLFVPSASYEPSVHSAAAI